MRGSWILTAALAASLVACDGGAKLDGLADAGTVTVVSAVDGDTVLLDDGRSIDLAGVQAPQGAEAHAAAAQVALDEATRGRPVRLLHGGSANGPYHLRDAQSRAWIQADLIEAGAVRVRTAPADRAMAREMLSLEAKARSERAGLWAAPEHEVRLPSEIVARREIGFRVVEGRVVRVAEQAGRVYLEFARRWRGGFSAEVQVSDKPGFAAAGLPLDRLQGRLVRVRGVIRQTSFGPRLTLSHPEQVEALREPDRR